VIKQTLKYPDGWIKLIILTIVRYTNMEKKNDSLTLTEIYKSLVAEQLAAEKKYQKSFSKIQASAQTDELKSAIAPDATDIENHISRLSRAMESVKQKAQTQISAIDETLLESLKQSSGKGSSLAKDAGILQILFAVFSIKVARYESLHRMASAIEQPEYALLLEQCGKDNQNTLSYLNQIAQNIIYPEMQKMNAD